MQTNFTCLFPGHNYQTARLQTGGGEYIGQAVPNPGWSSELPGQLLNAADSQGAGMA